MSGGTRPRHDDPPIATVVVPAYNEAAVIGRCLDALLRGKPDDVSLEVVVACNGCVDDTAQVARAHAPDALVLDLPEPSKSAALNAADAAATAYPRVYLDADIELPFADLAELVRAFDDPTLLCAAPGVDFVLDGRPWAVRRFYAAFRALPYVTDAMIGTGVYALGERGHARLGRFPSIVADDEHVRSLFDIGERRTVAAATFRVRTPRTLRDLLRVRQRVYRGNAELARTSAHTGPTNSLRSVARVAASRPVSVGVFLAINVVARLRARRAAGEGVAWERDASTR